MTREEVYERLHSVFWDEFDDESIHIDDETTSADISGWDSFEHINLIVAVEKEFGIRISMKDAQQMKNVGEMVEIIINQGGK